jgi:hypothetical protein
LAAHITSNQNNACTKFLTQAPVSTAAACRVGNLYCFLRALGSLYRQLTIYINI